MGGTDGQHPGVPALRAWRWVLNALISSRMVGIGMVTCAYIYLNLMQGRPIPVSLQFTNLLVVFLSTYLCFSDPSKPFSIFKAVMLFFVIFFGLAPLLEYKLSLRYWGGSPIDDGDYLVANIAVIISMVIYILGYFRFFRKSGKDLTFFTRQLSIGNSAERGNSLAVRLLVLSSVLLLGILYYYNFSLPAVLLRGGEFDIALVPDDKTLGLVVANFLRPLVFNCFAVYLMLKKKADLYFLVLLFLAILGACPSALPRFETAALYMPIMFVYIWRSNLKGYHLNNILLLGFVFVFPLLELFRFFSSWGDLEFNMNLDFYSAGHFDAYQQLVRAMVSGSLSYGYQLLGVLLFFVPRSIWPDKPLGSGETLAHNIGLSFTNVSMPLLGEGYVNFGWLGMLLFVLMLAYVTAKLDRAFWVSKVDGHGSLFPLAYMELIGLFFFIMRGDLLSSFAYTCGIMASLFVISVTLRFGSVANIKVT